jgi:hypothetical protein
MQIRCTQTFHHCCSQKESSLSSQQVPMHFAPSEASGIGYVVSFAIGASIVTIILWILRFFHCWYTIRHDYNTSNMGSGTGISIDMVEAYNLLPSMHFRVMWAPGGLAGTLWSIGNIASMVSVQNLGEGVGYSVTQASMVRQSMNHRVITIHACMSFSSK